MGKTAIPGYHFAQSDDGAFAIEVDEPCEGVVTVTWKPLEYPSTRASMQMPADLFHKAVESYLEEQRERKRPKQSPRS